jgi:hypothetical protein
MRWHLLAGWDLDLLVAFGWLEVQMIRDTTTATSSSNKRTNHVQDCSTQGGSYAGPACAHCFSTNRTVDFPKSDFFRDNAIDESKRSLVVESAGSHQAQDRLGRFALVQKIGNVARKGLLGGNLAV